jgi:hypothetical protein
VRYVHAVALVQDSPLCGLRSARQGLNQEGGLERKGMPQEEYVQKVGRLIAEGCSEAL